MRKTFLLTLPYLAMEVVLPGGFVAAAYYLGLPFGLGKEPHLFNKVFASGDLLPVCIFILLNAFARLERVSEALLKRMMGVVDRTAADLLAERRRLNQIERYTLMGLAVGLLFVFLYFKIKVIPYSFPASDGQPADWWVTLFSILDIGVFIFISALGWIIARLEHTETK